MTDYNRHSASSVATDSKTQPDHQQGHEHDERNHSITPLDRQASMTPAERGRRNVNARLANPLAGITHATLEDMGARYARKHQIGGEEDIRAFRMGACLAQDPSKYSTVAGLTSDELKVLQKEFTNRWSQPMLLYVVIVLCSTCAAVQGMGECSFDLSSRVY